MEPTCVYFQSFPGASQSLTHGCRGSPLGHSHPEREVDPYVCLVTPTPTSEWCRRAGGCLGCSHAGTSVFTIRVWQGQGEAPGKNTGNKWEAGVASPAHHGHK